MKNLLQESAYDTLFGSRVERMRLVDDADITHKSVLDIGCGFGWCAWNFIQREVALITGIDISDDAADAFRALDSTRVKFYQASALDLPFDGAVFDTVVSWETIEHVPAGTESQMLAEIYRVLKPGGVFYLSTQHRNPISTLLDPAWWLIGHRHYTVETIAKLAKTAGFTIDKIYTKGGLNTVIFMLNLYIAKWLFRRRPFFEQSFKNRCTQEFSKPKGFTNIFLKCTKPVSTS